MPPVPRLSALARVFWLALPAETRRHAHAAVIEARAATRSLADGASDVVEEAIDHISVLFHAPPKK